MAQQLATLRSPAAYAGVTAYAHSHTGEAQAAAFLALGHAHLLDHDYDLAVADFKLVADKGSSLDDYAAYLTIQAYLQNNKITTAEPVLADFIKRYPDSISSPDSRSRGQRLSPAGRPAGRALRSPRPPRRGHRQQVRLPVRACQGQPDGRQRRRGPAASSRTSISRFR